MDYLDDVVSLKNFKFDFQYMTANGSYELFEGEYLTIHWEPMADVRAKLVSSSSGGASLDFDNSVIELILIKLLAIHLHFLYKEVIRQMLILIR